MPALVLGSDVSFIGEAEVGGLLAELRSGSGEYVFTGSQSHSVLRNQTAVGNVDLSGVAFDTITRQSAGSFVFEGAASPKQFTRTLTALLDLSAGTAVWAGRTTHGTRTAAGGLEFSGNVQPAREFIFTSKYSDVVVQGLIVGSSVGGFIGAGYIGSDEITTDDSLRFTGEVARAGAVTRFAYLGFPAVGLKLTGNATANKGFNYTPNLTGFVLIGAAYVPPALRFGSAVWYGTRDANDGTAFIDSSVWEAVVPNEEEIPNAPVSVWDVDVAGGGVVVAGNSSAW